MEAPVEKILVGEPEAAAMYSVCERTMFALRKAGEVPYVKLRGRILYPVDELRKCIKDKVQ